MNKSTVWADQIDKGKLPLSLLFSAVEINNWIVLAFIANKIGPKCRHAKAKTEL